MKGTILAMKSSEMNNPMAKISMMVTPAAISCCNTTNANNKAMMEVIFGLAYIFLAKFNQLFGETMITTNFTMPNVMRIDAKISNGVIH